MVNELEEYLNCQRGVLIAPAGHGKTTVIAECLNLSPEGTCHLILTHTHAGIASLRKKFVEKNVPNDRYCLETITGFAQRYVLHILGPSVLPSQEDKRYFYEAVSRCTEILKTSLLQNIIKLSFHSVFVDEYQDCTLSQHNMILELSRTLPLHILGDPLQGIFDFEKEALVDFDKDLPPLLFRRFNFLQTPWRWKDTNGELGTLILRLRNLIEKDSTKNIILDDSSSIGFHVIQKPDFPVYSKDYTMWLRKTINSFATDSCLILCPNYLESDSYGHRVLRGDIGDRMKFRARFDFEKRFQLVDAIDSEEYYNAAKSIDNFIEKCHRNHRSFRGYARLHELLGNFYFLKSNLDDWINFNNNTLVKKKKYKEEYDNLERATKHFFQFPNLKNLLECIGVFVSLPGNVNTRISFYKEIIKSINIAIEEEVSVYEAMKVVKTRIRHMGRRIEGMCIGTTLLTKGLEFDTVIIMDAEKFVNKKHFYVAISRARKILVFLTESDNLQFE